MKDYRLQIKVKNNYLLTAMERAGFYTAADISHAHHLCQNQVGQCLNLKLSLLNAYGGTRPVWVKLSEALGTLPEDLLPPQHMESPLTINVGSAEVSLEEIEMFLPAIGEPLLLPDAALEQKESLVAFREVLDTLTPREKKIIEQRFGLTDEGEFTLEEIAIEQGVSKERIRQIEAKALRKLKHPSRKRRFLELIRDDDPDRVRAGVFVADDPKYVERRLQRVMEGG